MRDPRRGGYFKVEILVVLNYRVGRPIVRKAPLAGDKQALSTCIQVDHSTCSKPPRTGQAKAELLFLSQREA